MKTGNRWATVLASALLVAGCGGDGDKTSVSSSGNPSPPAASAPVSAPAVSVPISEGAAGAVAPDPLGVKAVDVATGLSYPWGLVFLPDGRMLVTEKGGALRVVTAEGQVSDPLGGLPAIAVGGQGGLLDIALSPSFGADQLVYFTFTESNGPAGTHVAVARGRFAETRLDDVQVVFRQSTDVDNTLHFGSRLVFGHDGNLWVTFGERNDNWASQALDSHLGKVIRIAPDGSIPADNPYVGVAGVKPEVWSYGHRNPQGATVHPDTGALWLVEHGPRGGDELNLVQPKLNYGWPRITYGRHYDTGLPVGEGTTAPDVESPRYYWAPTSVSPSGIAFYSGTAVPAWRGSAFIGALSTTSLMRVTFNGDTAAGHEVMLADLGERIRDVRMGPDGNLYLLTDSGEGRILRVVAQ